MTAANEGDEVQVRWRSRITGVICDCPVYERSPHANSDPVYVRLAAPSSSEGAEHGE